MYLGFHRWPSKQHGVAVITALLLVFLAVSITTGLFLTASADVRRSQTASHHDQAFWNGMAGINWAGLILEQDDPSVDSTSDVWATPIRDLPVEGGTLSGSIDDEMGKLNLNNLLDAGSPPGQFSLQMQNLLAIIPCPVSLIVPLTSYMEAIQHKGKLQSMDDLLNVEGMTRETLDSLSDYLTVLPLRTPLNVNTASSEVLMATFPEISDSLAADLVKKRINHPWKTKAEFRESVPASIPIREELFSVNSEFFKIRVQSNNHDVVQNMSALLQRTATHTTTLLWTRVE
jgi:general secretion pathway protein K